MRIDCPCGKVLQVRDGLAGRKVKCPGCKEVLTVEEAPSPKGPSARPGPDRAAVAPMRNKKPARGPDDDGREGPRPRKKKDRDEPKESPGRLWLIVGVAALVLILAGGGVWLLLRDKKGEAPGDDKKVQKDGLAEAPRVGPRDEERAGEWDRPKDLSLTADRLGNEFFGDEEATRQKYRGKVIELTGVVRVVGRSLARKPFLVLQVRREGRGLSFTTAEKEPWHKVTPGQTVKLKVVFLPEAGWEYLTAGPLLDVSGEPAPTLAAEGIAQEFEADREAACEKYSYETDERTAVVLTGTVALIGLDPGISRVFLQTGNKLKIDCGIAEEDARRMRLGMRVKISATISALQEGQTTIRMGDCVLLKMLP